MRITPIIRFVRAGRRLRRVAPLVLSGTLLVAVLAAAPAGARAPARGGAVSTLAGNVLPGLDRMVDLGPASGSTRLDLSVLVQGRNPTGEAAAYRGMYTLGGARYHHFLTPAQIADRFGATAARWSSVRSWLAAGGLHVTYASPMRDLLSARGTVADIESRFGVTVRRYRVGDVEFLANSTAPQVPSALRVASVLGLNTLQAAATANQRTERAKAEHLLQPATDTLGRLAGWLGSNLFDQSPQALWGAYEAPAGNIGAGQTVAVFGAGATDQVIADLHQFETEHGLGHQTPVSVTHVGSGPFDDTSGLVEWNIDTQAAAGMAPGLDGIELYFARDLTDAHVAQMFSQWAGDANAPRQANASFGECEESVVGDGIDKVLGPILNNPAVAQLGVGTGLIDELQPVGDAILRGATLQGKSLFVASGDTGSSCPVVALPVVGAGNGVLNQVVPFTSYPATSPYATAVGGTVLYTTTTSPPSRALEYGWTFGGGGDSLFVDQPAYQQGVPGVTLPCVATVDGNLTNLGKPCRGVPDVAALSGDALTNAYPIVNAGKDSVGGGTSLSSPLWVGMWARVQAGSANPAGVGFANETIYRLGKAHQSRDFTDITTGLLGLPLVGNGLYTTGPGWDYVTGFGPPRLTNFIADANAG